MRSAWIGKAEQIKRERTDVWLAGSPWANLPDALPRVTGEFSFPVLLGAFPNRPAPFDPDSLRRELFAGPWPTGTLADYYEEVSYGALAVSGLVTGWVTTSHPDTYYEGSSNGLLPNDARTGDFIKELLDANDAAVEFGDFDNDGPDGIPNSGDDDGYADLAVFVHSESGGECGGSSDNIYSHPWVYRAWPISGGVPYETDDPSASGGTIKVDDYVIQPAVACAGGVIEIGGFCHEVGHALGLPDLFDENGGSSGAGDWDLMAEGNWNTPASPAHLSAWCRKELGWVSPTVVTWNGAVRQIPQIETNPVCFELPFTDDRFERMGDCALSGSYSLRCGLASAEAAARHWDGGGGYGNGWRESVERPFIFDGAIPVVFSYEYAHELEPLADSAIVYLNVAGSRTALAGYTGTGSGMSSIDISAYLGAYAPPTPYSLEFCVTSDGAWSDEDGKNLTTCGAFSVDNVVVSGGGENYSTNFESSVDGWRQDRSKNPPAEYWLVENRQRVGFDGSLHGTGLLVWHVDDEVLHSALGNSGGAGGETVRGLVLEEADGMGQLLQDPATSGNPGDAGDPFPGSANNVMFNESSTPASSDNSASPTRCEVSSIGPSAAIMTAFLRAGDPAPVLATVIPAVVENDKISAPIQIRGEHLQPGAAFRFARDGQSDITALSQAWRDPTELSGEFNVYSRKGGPWDVVLVNPDGQQSVLSGGLMMVQIVAVQLVSAYIDVPSADRVEITVELRGMQPGERLALSRADRVGSAWKPINADIVAVGDGVYQLIDDTVEPARSYEYRVEIWSEPGDMREIYSGPAEIPSAPFRLEYGVPNPFNPSTTIRFSLPERAEASLAVFDITGRLVRTLAAETLPAGRQTQVWDGRDDRGARVSSGVYLVRLQAGGHVATQKILLLK
jgi:M6 family metalloprotease-like protein